MIRSFNQLAYQVKPDQVLLVSNSTRSIYLLTPGKSKHSYISNEFSVLAQAKIEQQANSFVVNVTISSQLELALINC